MNQNKKFILITAGDPAGISTEITIKALENCISNKNIHCIVITDPNLVEHCKTIIKSDIEINQIKDLINFSDYKINKFNIIPIALTNPVKFGKPDVQNCSFTKSSILVSVETYLNSIASAIVTNPINKHLMHMSGFQFEGHTDFLASLSKRNKIPVMMFVVGGLKTLPLTIHIPFKEVPKQITKKLIINKIKIATENLAVYFNIKKPRISVTGLNPHAGENGDLGYEEINVIKPAIDELKTLEGIDLDGPISPDSAFSSTIRNKYDLIVCMYHDQALIPIKTLDFFNGVNVTLGLDFIRTSPDHGTGFEIAGKNLASPKSLTSAINLAYEMSINKNNGL